MTGFLSWGIVKLLENGAVDINAKRFDIQERDCQSSILSSNVNPLSMKKLIALFALLILAAVASWLILVCELVFWKTEVLGPGQPQNESLNLKIALTVAQKYVDKLEHLLATDTGNKESFDNLLEPLALEIERRKCETK